MPGVELTIALGGNTALGLRSSAILANDNPSLEQKLFEHSVERELIDEAPE